MSTFTTTVLQGHPAGPDTESNDIFEYVRKPRRYFRVGRVFATRWAEPWSEYKDASKNPSPRLSPKSRVFEETRRFIVVQESHGASLCVPIHTYRGRGLGKDNIRLEDHARVYHDKTNPPKHEPHMREPIGVVVEPDSQLPQLHPQSVANFGKIYTVEHGVKIANIGFVHKSQKHRLQVSWKSTTVDEVSTGSKTPNNLGDVDGSHNPGQITCGRNIGHKLDCPDDVSQASQAGDVKTTVDREIIPQKGQPGMSLNSLAMASLRDGNTGSQNPSSDATSLSSTNMEHCLHDSDVQARFAAVAELIDFLLDEGAFDNVNNNNSAIRRATDIIIHGRRDSSAGIETHSRVPRRDLQVASTQGPEQIVSLLLDKGPDSDTLHSCVSRNAPQAAPLPDKPTVPLLSDKRVNANERNTLPHNKQSVKRSYTDAMTDSSKIPRGQQTKFTSNKRQKHNHVPSGTLVPA